MADYPNEFDFDAVLADGAIIRVRPIRPEDAEKERLFFRRVSPESAYFRFFSLKHELSDHELRYFTQVDYDRRMAFVAVHEDDIVAVGRYDVVDDIAGPDQEPGQPGQPVGARERIAEVAFLVEDAFQGRGIGTILLQQLAVYARAKGVTGFRAYVLANNQSMLEVFHRSGYAAEHELRDGVYTLELGITYSAEAKDADARRERHSVASSLEALFRPRSVAVIGASRDPTSIGGRMFQNLLLGGFTGPVFPVHPTSPVIRSVKAYASVLDIADPVDLAIIVVPAAAVLGALEACAQKGVRGVVVISAGFGETGEQGREAEARLVELVRRSGMRMVGPNCMGMVNTDPDISLNAQFGPIVPAPGNVAMSSQSGALGLAILFNARQMNIGISSFVSVGNKADVSGNDLLLYWEDDPRTDVILLYLESFGNPRRFARLARRVARKKPIVAVKSGRSTSGALAAASHTGSLANIEVAVEALFRQTGVIRVDTLEELFDVTSLLAHQPVPRGRRVAVLTNAGGPAILCADALEARGLVLPELSEPLRAELQRHLAAAASTRNPVDMIASAGPAQYHACLRALLRSEDIDAVIVIYIPPGAEGLLEVAAAVHAAAVETGAHAAGKTLLAVFLHGHGTLDELSREGVSVPVYSFPEPAARALAAAVRYGEWRAAPEGKFVHHNDLDEQAVERVLDQAFERLGPDGGWLMFDEVERMLAAFGVPVAASARAYDRDQAVEAARALGGHVALKIMAPSSVHKSDVGGVALDLSGDAAVAEAYDAIMSRSPRAEGVIVQAYIPGGHEVIVGMTENSLFGPLMAFGLGGVYVELMRDVAFRIHPLTDVDVDQMIAEVRAARLLEGYRGAPPGDVPALRDLMFRVSALIERFSAIAEMDLNPVKVLQPGQGVRVVDGRIRVRPPTGTWLPSRKDLPWRVD